MADYAAAVPCLFLVLGRGTHATTCMLHLVHLVSGLRAFTRIRQPVIIAQCKPRLCQRAGGSLGTRKKR